MKQLIALVAIAAATYVPDQPGIAEGEKFPAPDDVAEKMLADKVARLDDEAEAGPAAGANASKGAAKPAKRTKVRLLIDSALGNCNDVVEVDSADVKKLEADSLADSSKEAVAYASTLEQNKPAT